MAGVLFIICIPCENYERCIANLPSTSGENVVKDKKTTLPNLEISSNDSSDSASTKASKESLNTSAISVSIESDSLNRNAKDKKMTDKEGRMGRTRSLDEELIVDEKKISDEKQPEIRGSADSDVFRRSMERKQQMRENDEAIEKFFNVKIEKPRLDIASPMEKIIREIIERMRIRNASWQRVNGGNSFKVSFSLEKGVRCDDTIHLLSEFGIGQRKGSSIAIVPCTLYSDKSRLKDDDEASTSTQAIFKETAWNRFIGTVRATLNVAKTVDAVKSDASLTFDFIILLVVASMLASFGLVENSTLFLAASMLISPLMGPILAATFGTVIKDRKLQFWGLRNEMVGIFMCIFVGFFFGMIICLLGYNVGTEGGLSLTQEMLSRCSRHSVVVGIFIALPSGAAVAIAVLGENFGSLVGVAISASLLPPAVNTGLLWSFSCVSAINKSFELQRFKAFVDKAHHSENEAIDLLILGTISLCVTLTNVLCVYLMGFIFLRIKIEVAPVLTEEEKKFWKHDVPIARDYNKTLNAEEGNKLAEELAGFRKNPSENFKGVGAELLRQEFYPQTHTWSPLTYRYRKENETTRTSLRELDAMYKSLSGKIASERGEKLNRQLEFYNPNSPHCSVPIPMPTSSTCDHIKNNSAPLSSISEHVVVHKSTYIHVDSSNDEATPSEGGYRKFIVTPTVQPFK